MRSPGFFDTWEARESANAKHVAIYPAGSPKSSGCVATVPLRDGRETGCRRAARLIAAAPDLFVLLQEIVFFTGPNSPVKEACEGFPQELRDRAVRLVERIV